MDEAVVNNPLSEMPTEVKQVIDKHLLNLQSLLEQMSQEQKEINLLRSESQAMMREMDRILSETRKVLSHTGAS
jgi:hypothetical protein